MKIDVEGYEEDVLKGASQTLAKDSVLAIIIENQKDEVNQVFRDAGFIDVNYLPLRRLLQSHSEKKCNRIWIKESKKHEIETRLQTAQAFSVYRKTV